MPHEPAHQDRGYPILDATLGAQRQGRFPLAPWVQPTIDVEAFETWPAYAVHSFVAAVVGQTSRLVLRVPNAVWVQPTLRIFYGCTGVYYKTVHRTALPFVGTHVPKPWGASPASRCAVMSLASVVARETDNVAPDMDLILQAEHTSGGVLSQVNEVERKLPTLSGSDLIVEAEDVNNMLSVEISWMEKVAR